jgi:hypothetical protein
MYDRYLYYLVLYREVDKVRDKMVKIFVEGGELDNPTAGQQKVAQEISDAISEAFGQDNDNEVTSLFLFLKLYKNFIFF